MPFEKKPPSVPLEPSAHRTLLAAALLLAVALFLAGLGVRLFPREEVTTVLQNVLEEEAVVAFLQLEPSE